MIRREVPVDLDLQIINKIMKLNKQQKDTLIKKLEYTFKKSERGKELLEKLMNENLINGDLNLLINKLEYRFKTSDSGKKFIEELTK